MITVSMLAKIRRMHFRDGVPLRDISRRTGLSRNTIRRWLREPSTGEPKYPKRSSKSVIDAWAEQLRQWLIADSRRPKRDRRTATQIYEELRAAGYDGSYQRVCAFVRSWKQERDEGPQRGAFVPMSFEYGDAFQFDWNCEYVFICGLRQRLEVAHVKQPPKQPPEPVDVAPDRSERDRDAEDHAVAQWPHAAPQPHRAHPPRVRECARA